ncbi:tyrosine-type recombinase/integrase [Nocardiopsis suaedae]|uniref:Site-specific integrase n=1 Tax=Nocardiopsis suaedae TaxID=3018444 RepID=A0ABT4TIP3_9ACTN|nr:site-specific integrase [Nocardiopsis suaedae]MDA2804580.1 site-specific integrase [Nocardiopsis suaedae]
MAVYDRWHKSRPRPDDELCREHKKAPTAEHGVGKRWQVRWRDEDGEQQKRNFDKKSGKNPDVHAEAFDAKVKADLDSGRGLDLDKGRMKVAAFGALWRADLIHRKSTAERMERVFKVHVDPILGNLEVAKVRASHIRRWIKDRNAVLAPSTMSVVYSNLKSLFAWAVIDRVISISPCDGVKLPKETEKHEHFIPTPDQVHGVAEHLPARYSAIPYLGAGCGLRGGEIMGLEVDAIDLEAGEIDVGQQLVCVTGRKPYLGPVKTMTSARTVEVPDVTLRALERHLERFPPVEVEIEDETNPKKPTTRAARLAFMWAGMQGNARDLSPIPRGNWSHAWSAAARPVGIPKGKGLHSLRHFFATRLIHGGASVKTVQLALGHATPTITLNTYVGEWPEAHERTRSLMDRALGNVP